MTNGILLASGCSYTDKNFYSTDDSIPDIKRGGWPMWPELVSNKLNLTCVNTALCGQCNTISINKTIKFILENEKKVNTVMILLSSWDRFQIFNGPSVIGLHSIYNIIFNAPTGPNYNNFIIIKGLLDYIKKQKNFFMKYYEDSMVETLSSLYYLIKLCEMQNIKYIFAQGVFNWDYDSVNELIYKEFKDHSNTRLKNYLKYISSSVIGENLEKRSDKLIGWPFEKLLGGYSIDDLRIEGSLLNKGKFKNIPGKVSKIDDHPNAKEQEVIANIFLEKYGEIYG